MSDEPRPLTDAELDELDASITDRVQRKRELEDEIVVLVRRYRAELSRRSAADVRDFRPRPATPLQPPRGWEPQPPPDFPHESSRKPGNGDADPAST
jgi:hypothetical protein